MGLLDNLRGALRALPAPSRALASIDAAVARADRLGTRGLDAVVALAGAATASWRPTPPSTTLTQITPVQLATWTVSDVRNALDSHEFGMFVDSSTLVDAMGRDDRITGCLNTR